MNPLIALFAAVTGYLLGSISFARVIVRLVAPGQELTGIEMEIADAKEPVHVEAYSGTAVAQMLGDKWGGMTALLDILKAAVPTLVSRTALLTELENDPGLSLFDASGREVLRPTSIPHGIYFLRRLTADSRQLTASRKVLIAR